MFAVKLRSAWAAAEHLLDAPKLLAEEQPDALIVDCLLFGALAVLENGGVPTMEIAGAVDEVLVDPSYASSARSLADIIARTRVSAAAVDRLEGTRSAGSS